MCIRDRAISTPHPFAGEPIITAAIPVVEEFKTASTTAPEEEAPAEDTPVDEGGVSVQIEAPVEQDSYQTEASIILSPRRPLKPAPIADLIEISTMGQLPRIGPGNRKPSDVYARNTPMGVIHSERPKIAILLGGMGLNAKLTQQAIKNLPGDVTFAFAPYGENLQSQVNKARADGHEVIGKPFCLAATEVREAVVVFLGAHAGVGLAVTDEHDFGHAPLLSPPAHVAKKDVARAVDRLDQARVLGILAEFGPEPRDAHIHGPVEALSLIHI